MSQLPHFSLKKPDLKKVDRGKVIAVLEKDPTKYRKLLEEANEPSYIYWDKFQYKVQDNILDSEELWYLIRQFRNISSTEILIKSEGGEFFKWLRLPSTEEYLHEIDMVSGGQLLPYPNVISQSNQQTFINRGIIEEAIASSQLEGAHTTRAVAKKMIIEKREPRNESERMIFNNYKTINAIEEDYKSKNLSLDLLFEIHGMLTQETVNKTEQNRLRNDKDEIAVQGQIGSTEYISHVPPNERFVKSEINRLIEYANDQTNEKFTHPIIKAIFLHFWVGYLHPFTDGNGRLARALFYWYLLRKGYWTFMFLPISTVIKKAPGQYSLAYIYSEQDGLDITYFYDFHLRKILQAIREFQSYLENKIKENKKVDMIISKKIVLNERQKQLVHYFISDTNPSTTVSSHSVVNNVSRQTAAKDLKQLESVSFLYSKKEGKYVRYYPSEKLIEMAKR
ncbi:Fic family protein [Candidatus Shapirobacteria bacterium]|nr:Fic family protein [Candidatus Shapirobacteria bacterium]